VAHNETYLQEAGVLSQKTGQLLQGPGPLSGVD
jgi:hypothetical protein